MNSVQSRTSPANLRDEETLLVENAIRLAIDSILNVLSGVHSARTHEYQRTVADRDKEIRRLDRRLLGIEHELQVLRRQGCTCSSVFGDELGPGGPQTSSGGPGGSHTSSGGPGGSGVAQTVESLERGGFELGCLYPVGPFARPLSHVSSQSPESAPLSSPSRMCLEQACASLSSETSGVLEAARLLPSSPSSLVVKEEPCDIDTVLIKWEMSEERFGECQESTGSTCQDEDSLAVKKTPDGRERVNFREEPEADEDENQITDGEHLRNKKKGVPMSQLPEEAQRLKRAAWRAASRRYYARKVARQQPNPSRCNPFPHMSASQYAQPLSFMDKRRRTLISHLPEESQLMQREAWRAASRRYYARKTARPQMDHTQYEHLLQNTEPSGETQEPDGAGSHGNSEGIMCS
ncbi:uncharacterized protein LOC118113515 isoform X2 [Hippoglossus stenolepis]|uniref:uncharacterized protein LOC118113515 isoform X2 n=1 Tax=Hippoglossus stenolepis TaxID=195615 RepID=UPI001FB00ACF|nr:uncharacterized protein LOC118113515 isoform X2 [Hippoglossus stenolepis]